MMRILLEYVRSVPGTLMDALCENVRDDSERGFKSLDWPQPTRRHLVIPKEYVNRMPFSWQVDLRKLMHELTLQMSFDPYNSGFQILKRDKKGRFKIFSTNRKPSRQYRNPEELF
jgi:hypothetical protein